ncbi:dehydrogenase/reductase SDR family member 8 precursor [Didymella exigua CBS 183.55]|uniref:Short-chain dehydrogenase/reductase 3 n=1 Tax=Didymella exigua CBS 183.55 TaxID=1150837 RepID=A0A6A5R9B0_9PLEO|nr:dehydrogenase/reductase SDR family member 8 precursor [Didymella exigua CBS 183.55]KAF1923778.1 dehydrogenase/reductase SDR family member 8 precursor [Didymella exigua CBS 183.55]
MSAALQRVSNIISLSISHLTLNPAVTASLLYVLTKGPDSLRARLTDRFAVLRDPSRHATIVRVLKWCLTLGLLKTVNKTLNHLALNNYRLKSVSAQWNWDKEIAVVTGGCSGIGALIVKRLVSRGVTVAILDVQQLPADFQGYAHIRFYSCDITDPSAVADAASRIKKELGSPSILVNNAGILSAHTILATPHEYLRKIFDVNVLSNWTTVQAFLPDMLAQNKGHVVTVASSASYVSVAGMTDYCATKGAVLAFHEGLNQELRLSYNAPAVLTTSVHPAWVRTPLLAPVEQELKKRGAVIMEPTDVADAVAKQVFSCRGAQVFLPGTAGKIAWIRALPNWVQERVRTGVSRTITESVEIGGM